MPEKHLDTIVTLIAGKPVRLSIALLEQSGNSRDPLNQRPFAYIFREVVRKAEQTFGEFVVYVSDMVAEFRLKDSITRNRTAIQYGVRAKNSEFGKSEFLLTRETLQQFENQPKLNGKKLEAAILSYYLAIYEIWPAEALGIPDLEVFFQNDTQELTDWTRDLVQRKYLVSAGQNKTWPRETGYGFSSSAYRINAVVEEQALDFVARNSPSQTEQKRMTKQIFISYSSVDKALAGQLKSKLESEERIIFLAHEDIDVSEDWELMIRMKIKECDVFLALITENFRNSDWTDQEVGQAIAKGATIISLFRPSKPHGFLGRLQGLYLGDNLDELCEEILKKI
ncbi:MAG: toll/interleukin-1 receptor domain-containing protein [Candidatus Zixiibacteriota bacterium]